MKHLNLKQYKLAKSVLSVFLAFCVMLGSFGLLPTIFSYAEAPEIWGGQSDLSAPADSDNDGIYEITKGSELAYIIKNGAGGNSYILTKDIYLNDVSKINWETGVADSGYTVNPWYGNYESTPFSGKIDGNGHIVYGMYFNIGTSYGAYYNYTVGLIPAVDGAAEIKNLGVDKMFINYESFAAAFVGRAAANSTVSFDSCFVGQNVYIKAYSVGAFRGYAAGMATTITNCYSLATMKPQGGEYGLAGYVWGALNIANSFNGNGPLVSQSDDYYSTLTDILLPYLKLWFYKNNSNGVFFE